MNLSINTLLVASKLTLAFLWIFTGLTSLFFSPQLGFNIIISAGFSPDTTNLLIFSGSIIDFGIGLWVLTAWEFKLCSVVQIAAIITYTILLTIFDSSYWLHPFGPLTKNLPILVLILINLKLNQTVNVNIANKRDEKS